MHATVILNPVAGHSNRAAVRKVVARHMGGAGWSYDIYETTGEESLPDVVHAAISGGAELVVAAGGDGTVSGVVDGLVGEAIPLGIIPAGTTNALAQELGIPRNVEKACRLLVQNPAGRRIDAIRVGERYFVLTASMGAGAETMAATGRGAKRRLGTLAYIWEGIKVLAGWQPHRFTLTIDGHEIQTRAAEITLVNAGTLTGPFRWGSHIHPDDGQIDVCIIYARNLWDFAAVTGNILLGRQRQDRHIRYEVARETVTVRTAHRLLVQGDGEPLGHFPLEVQVVPGAVEVLVPGRA